MQLCTRLADEALGGAAVGEASCGCCGGVAAVEASCECRRQVKRETVITMDADMTHDASYWSDCDEKYCLRFLHSPWSTRRLHVLPVTTLFLS